jgi:hypothetical protein
MNLAMELHVLKREQIINHKIGMMASIGIIGIMAWHHWHHGIMVMHSCFDAVVLNMSITSKYSNAIAEMVNMGTNS